MIDKILTQVAANTTLKYDLQDNWNHFLAGLENPTNWEIISESDPSEKFGYDWDFFDGEFDKLIAVVNFKLTDDTHYYIYEKNGKLEWEAHSGGKTGNL